MGPKERDFVKNALQNILKSVSSSERASAICNLAATLNYRAYLCRCFKKEIGIRIWNYTLKKYVFIKQRGGRLCLQRICSLLSSV